MNTKPNTAQEAAAILDLSLDPALGLAHTTFDSQTKEEKLVLGYKGLLELAYRTGEYSVIGTSDVRRGELKRRDSAAGQTVIDIEEDADKREALPIVGYIGYYKRIDGEKKTVYLTSKQIGKQKARFGCLRNILSADEAARKIVLRRLLSNEETSAG